MSDLRTTQFERINDWLRIPRLWDEQMDQSGTPSLYERTVVLLLSWCEKLDELKTKEEVEELKSVFENYYKFEVVHRVIDEGKAAQTQANWFLSHFVLRYDDKNTLFIIYYAGHGWPDKEDKRFRLTGDTSIAATKNQKQMDNATIVWDTVEYAIERTKASILVIFDCCYAGHICRPKINRAPRHYEILAACGENQKTPGPSDQSFTKALIWTLKALSQKQCFSTRQLCEEIKKAPSFKNSKSQPLIYTDRLKSDPWSVAIVLVPPNPAIPQQGLAPLPPWTEEVNVENGNFMDVRLWFDQELDDDFIIDIAKSLKRSMAYWNLEAKRVSYLNHKSLKNHIKPVVSRLENLRQRKSKLSQPNLTAVIQAMRPSDAQAPQGISPSSGTSIDNPCDQIEEDITAVTIQVVTPTKAKTNSEVHILLKRSEKNRKRKERRKARRIAGRQAEHDPRR